MIGQYFFYNSFSYFIEKVTIIYNIEEVISKEFIFSISDLTVLNLNDDLEIAESDLNTSFTVKMTGFKSILDIMENEDLVMSVDLKDLTEGRHDIEIIIDEIQGITLEEISPQPLTINLIKR